MDALVEALGKTPLPTILVVAGIVFLFLAVGGQLGARISTRKLRPAYTAILGALLLLIGIWLQISASRTPEPTTAGASAPSPSPSATGAPTYSLRAPLQRGKILRQDWKWEMPAGKITLDLDGKYISGTDRSFRDWSVATEFVAVDDDQPVLARQTFRSDHRRYELEVEKMPPIKSETTGPLVGETILFEQKNGQWQKSLVNKQPTAEEQAELDQQVFVNPDSIYPNEKVAPGYVWHLKDEQLAYFLPPALSIKGDATCTFAKIESHGGEKCAVITQHLEASVKMLFQNVATDYQIGGDGYVYRSLEKLIDLDGFTNGQMLMKFSTVFSGQKADVEINGGYRMSGHATDITDER